MDNDDVNIQEIDMDDISSIVDKGLKEKVSFKNYLKNSIKELGLKNIFHDKSELFVIALAGIMIMIMSLSNIDDQHINNLYKSVFIISPLLYLSVVLFSFYNSKEKGAFDIEMTCKYNLCQLSALRMYIFSICSIILNTCAILVIWILGKPIDAVRMIIISATGLFMFSALLLYSLVKIKWKYAKYIVILLWFFVNIILSSFDNKVYMYFLMKVPLYIHLIISVICFILYVKNLKNLVNYSKTRGD